MLDSEGYISKKMNGSKKKCLSNSLYNYIGCNGKKMVIYIT